MNAQDHVPPEEAARRASDPNRLMLGEDPRSFRLDDAAHWIKVYEQLTSFKDDVLAATKDRIDRFEAPAAEEIRGSDLVLLRAERARFVSRLEFWKARLHELQGLPPG